MATLNERMSDLVPEERPEQYTSCYNTDFLPWYLGLNLNEAPTPYLNCLKDMGVLFKEPHLWVPVGLQPPDPKPNASNPYFKVVLFGLNPPKYQTKNWRGKPTDTYLPLVDIVNPKVMLNPDIIDVLQSDFRRRPEHSQHLDLKNQPLGHFFPREQIAGSIVKNIIGTIRMDSFMLKLGLEHHGMYISDPRRVTIQIIFNDPTSELKKLAELPQTTIANLERNFEYAQQHLENARKEPEPEEVRKARELLAKFEQLPSGLD